MGCDPDRYKGPPPRTASEEGYITLGRARPNRHHFHRPQPRTSRCDEARAKKIRWRVDLRSGHSYDGRHSFQAQSGKLATRGKARQRHKAYVTGLAADRRRAAPEKTELVPLLEKMRSCMSGPVLASN